ncbi:MAG: DUF4251 domain-containing protein [Bacteroidales bacterium]|nr:DUF4251 domain-containing protein [Bacteroidales bacterium]
MKGKLTGLVFILIIPVLLTDCAALTSGMDKYREKREKKIKEGYEAMKEMAFSGLYKFSAKRAYGSGYPSIDIAGGRYYLIVHYYDVVADLPFYGIQHMADTERGSGISIDGKLEDIMIEESDSRNRVLVRFSVESNSERYLINLDISPGGEANLTISSLKRSTIIFIGDVTPIEPEKEEDRK